MKGYWKMKKINALILAFALIFSMGSASVWANDQEAQPYYITFTDVVKEVVKEDGKITSLLLGKDDVSAMFKLSENTYIANADIVKEGDEITGYMPANKPMILIYPPQYTPEVIVVKNDKAETVHVDFFDENYVSSDGSLKLNPETVKQVKYQNGLDFYGDLKELRLVVTYTASTRSIPAYPLAPTVVVLIDDEVSTPQILPLPIEDTPIVVNGQTIEGANAFRNDDGVTMLPLRKIAEALDFAVQWEQESQSIFLGNQITLKIGADYYTYMRTAPISLGTAPVLVEGNTYVPFDFFKEVAKITTIEIKDNQIIINQ